MTNVTFLGGDAPEKIEKPIEFTHALLSDCKSFNLGRKHLNEFISTPTKFESIVLIAKKSDGFEFDIFLCTIGNEKHIMFGNYNDGAVE